jgi:hypothetical protein
MKQKPKPEFRTTHLWTGRTLVWFSCGAASAVAWKLAVERFPGDLVEACYCSDTLANEHPDNVRFLADVEKWVGREVTMLKSAKYHDVYEVFEGERYLNGASGAPCTRALKRNVRIAYQEPWDWHVFGYTADEQDRIDSFEAENPDINAYWLLREQGVTKDDCYAILHRAGIALPAMYLLGYRNNNCIGCVKGGAGYWNKIRVDFPEVFWRMARLERAVGHALLKLGGVPVYLDELPPDAGRYESEPDIECGPQCVQIMSRIEKAAACEV